MKEKGRASVLVLIDIILFNLSFVFAYILRFDGQIDKITNENIKNIIHVVVIAIIIKVIISFLFRLYSSLWRYAGIYEMLSIIGGAFCANAAILLYALVINTGVPRGVFIITFFTDIALTGGVRFAYRVFRRVVTKKITWSENLKRVLIVGGGEAGAILIKELKTNSQLQCIPVAIIDDDKSKVGRKINGISVLGDRKYIREAVKIKQIEEIIIAIPTATKRDINDIFSECTKTHCKVKILPSVSQLIDGSVSIKKVRDVNIEDLLGRDPVKLDNAEISSYITNRIVLITGGGGSIGSELCRQIATFMPKQLIILDNYENNAFDIQNELQHKFPQLKLTIIIANIRESLRLESIFKKHRPEVIFHAAAHKHVPLMEENPSEAIKNNVFGTMNVAECADKFHAKKFVLISTDKAVNPTNIMGATKRIAEMIIQSTNKNSKTEFVAVRFGNVLGSNGSVIPFFKKQIQHGGPVTVTHPEITRFFMTIPEAAQLVIQAGAMAKGGEIFVLDMGQPVKIYDLARNLIKLSGFEPDEDIKIEFTGLRPGEKLYEELLMEEEGLTTTKNEKIFIAPPVFSDLFTLKKEIRKLNELIIDNKEEILDYIPRIVPTYKRAE